MMVTSFTDYSTHVLIMPSSCNVITCVLSKEREGIGGVGVGTVHTLLEPDTVLNT